MRNDPMLRQRMRYRHATRQPAGPQAPERPTQGLVTNQAAIVRAEAPKVRRINDFPTGPTLIFDEEPYLNLWWFLNHCGTTNKTEIACFAQHEKVPGTAATYRVTRLVTSLLRNLSGAFCAFDDNARAFLPLKLAKEGIDPGSVVRTWCHTHPGTSVTPSSEDHDTFSYFYHPDRGHYYPYAFMIIMGTDGRVGAHMSFNASRTGECSELDRGENGAYVVVEMQVKLPAISKIIRAEPVAALDLIRNHPVVVANQGSWDAIFDRDIRPGIATPPVYSFRQQGVPSHADHDRYSEWEDRVIGGHNWSNWRDRHAQAADDDGFRNTDRAFGEEFGARDVSMETAWDAYAKQLKFEAERKRQQEAEAWLEEQRLIEEELRFDNARPQSTT